MSAKAPRHDPDEDGFVEPDPCPACGGAGWVYREPDEDRAYRDGEEDGSVACPVCGGSGKAQCRVPAETWP